ncbi:MAG: HAMP domain-containing protein [Betaproteobacteria bacterium]|nr:HAMP domain-containing protein [Betaproteobacteria bacterium]
MKNRLNITFLTRMKLWQKFLLLGAVALPAAGVPAYLFLTQTTAAIQTAKLEASGIAPATKLLKLIQNTQQHRGLSAALIGGNISVAADRAAKEAEVVRAISTFEPYIKNSNNSRQTEVWDKIKTNWTRIAAETTSQRTDTRKSFTDHSTLVATEMTLLNLLMDHYKLSFESDTATHFLIQAALSDLPQVSESLGQTRAFGAARLAEAERLTIAQSSGAELDKEALTSTDRATMATLISALVTKTNQAIIQLNKAQAEETRIKDKIAGKDQIAEEQIKRLADLAAAEISNAQRLKLSSAEYVKQFTGGINDQFKLIDTATAALNDELQLKVDGLLKRSFILSGVVIAFIIFAALLALLITRNITETVRLLQISVEKVRHGDNTALGSIDAQDEVGDLGRTVNQLLEERMAAQRKAEAETETLNDSVISLLQTMQKLSDKNLTAKAPVTQDIVGTVSDAVNQHTEETSRVLYRVMQIAGQVENASVKLKGQADQVQATSEIERKGVEEMIRELATSTEAMNNVAQLTAKSHIASGDATRSTLSALNAVTGTMQGMNSIREMIAETEKRIKRLGERSQEISGIVNLINTIAERTHVLALNASVQAAVAGDAGRGFAVVAEEVQRLAESSRNATAQIGTLVNNIQIETNDTINTVNKTISQVVQGTEFAEKAGVQMAETQKATDNLVDLVLQIAASLEVQVKSAEILQNKVDDLGRSAEKTGEQITTQTAEANLLSRSAEQLVKAVGVFKLPSAQALGLSIMPERTSAMPKLQSVV